MRDPVKTVYAVTLFAMMLLAGCFGSGVVDTPEVEAQATGSEVTLAQFTTLEGAVTAAENAITTVQTSLTNHETRIAALETKLAAAEAALQGLNNQATGGTNAAPIVEVEGARFVASEADGEPSPEDQYDMDDDRGGCDTILDSQIATMASQQYRDSNYLHEGCWTNDSIKLAIDLKALDIDGGIVSVDIDFNADGVIDSNIMRIGGGYLVDLPATFWGTIDETCDFDAGTHCDYLFFVAVTDDLGARTWAVGGAWINYIGFKPVMKTSFSVSDAADDIDSYVRDELLTITPNAHWPSTQECKTNGWEAPCYRVEFYSLQWQQWGYYDRYTDWNKMNAITRQDMPGNMWNPQQTMTLSEGVLASGQYSGTAIDVCDYYGGPYQSNPCHADFSISYVDDDHNWHNWRFNNIAIW